MEELKIGLVYAIIPLGLYFVGFYVVNLVRAAIKTDISKIPSRREELRIVPAPELGNPALNQEFLGAESLAKDPPKVRPCGGEDFSLEIRPSFTGYYYGYGWLSGNNVTRSTKFNLLFTEKHHIQKGDVAMIRIADLNPPYMNELQIWSSHYDIVHKDSSWGDRLHRYAPTEWLQLSVEIRSREAEESWKHSYGFRLTGRETFEVEEVKPTPNKPSADQVLLKYWDRIRDAIQEDSNHIFFRKIQDLYPKLEECGIQMPSILPFVDSDQWRNYHIRFLKDLEMQITKIEDGVSLNLEQWNNVVLNIEKDRDTYMGINEDQKDD